MTGNQTQDLLVAEKHWPGQVFFILIFTLGIPPRLASFDDKAAVYVEEVAPTRETCMPRSGARSGDCVPTTLSSEQ